MLSISPWCSVYSDEILEIKSVNIFGRTVHIPYPSFLVYIYSEKEYTSSLYGRVTFENFLEADYDFLNYGDTFSHFEYKHGDIYTAINISSFNKHWNETYKHIYIAGSQFPYINDTKIIRIDFCHTQNYYINKYSKHKEVFPFLYLFIDTSPDFMPALSGFHNFNYVEVNGNKYMIIVFDSIENYKSKYLYYAVVPLKDLNIDKQYNMTVPLKKIPKPYYTYSINFEVVNNKVHILAFDKNGQAYLFTYELHPTKFTLLIKGIQRVFEFDIKEEHLNDSKYIRNIAIRRNYLSDNNIGLRVFCLKKNDTTSLDDLIWTDIYFIKSHYLEDIHYITQTPTQEIDNGNISEAKSLILEIDAKNSNNNNNKNYYTPIVIKNNIIQSSSKTSTSSHSTPSSSIVIGSPIIIRPKPKPKPKPKPVYSKPYEKVEVMASNLYYIPKLKEAKEIKSISISDYLAQVRKYTEKETKEIVAMKGKYIYARPLEPNREENVEFKAKAEFYPLYINVEESDPNKKELYIGSSIKDIYLISSNDLFSRNLSPTIYECLITEEDPDLNYVTVYDKNNSEFLYFSNYIYYFSPYVEFEKIRSEPDDPTLGVEVEHLTKIYANISYNNEKSTKILLADNVYKEIDGVCHGYWFKLHLYKIGLWNNPDFRSNIEHIKYKEIGSDYFNLVAYHNIPDTNPIVVFNLSSKKYYTMSAYSVDWMDYYYPKSIKAYKVIPIATKKCPRKNIKIKACHLWNTIYLDVDTKTLYYENSFFFNDKCVISFEEIRKNAKIFFHKKVYWTFFTNFYIEFTRALPDWEITDAALIDIAGLYYVLAIIYDKRLNKKYLVPFFVNKLDKKDIRLVPSIFELEGKYKNVSEVRVKKINIRDGIHVESLNIELIDYSSSKIYILNVPILQAGVVRGTLELKLY